MGGQDQCVSLLRALISTTCWSSVRSSCSSPSLWYVDGSSLSGANLSHAPTCHTHQPVNKMALIVVSAFFDAQPWLKETKFVASHCTAALFLGILLFSLHYVAELMAGSTVPTTTNFDLSLMKQVAAELTATTRPWQCC